MTTVIEHVLDRLTDLGVRDVAFPEDLAQMPVASSAAQIPPPTSNPAKLRDALDAIVAALESADTACVPPAS